MDFSQKKAWFSSSVPEFCKRVWRKRNGQITSDIFSADFIFAKDPEAADIKWFYKTKFFLQESIMPFNSSWLKNPSKNIIDFILYPKELQEKQFPLEWEFDDEEDDIQFHHLKDFKAAISIPELRPNASSSENIAKQPISMADTSVNSDHRHVDECSDNGSMATTESTSKTKKNVKSSHGLTSLQDLEVHTHGFQSSMHDGFVHVEDLQVPDEVQLEDFPVNSNSYQVFLIDPP